LITDEDEILKAEKTFMELRSGLKYDNSAMKGSDVFSSNNEEDNTPQFRGRDQFGMFNEASTILEGEEDANSSLQSITHGLSNNQDIR
jgi:hypothetical protein